MSPSSCSRRRRRTRTTTRNPSSRRTLFKNKKHNNLQTSSSKIQETSAVSPAKPSTDLSDISKNVENVDSSHNISACSTPKGRRFRIPEIKTCPPAPKKRRLFTAAGCSSLRRSTPVAFFAHPDIELFFYLALRGVPV
ncbi:Cyclin-dependent protein kinase inhibitor SMR9 [Sesamum alatum]|uniref:Cyclin-dependent protein kinase inhibitor SMR9 n=1 Tax=Sesamum alatum TaxID=300844 RepID=A0AAE1XX67_9LAMI|nr:Cyclin-dependent protein kinase inhibitor SMR9 [Sesamum alatum]